MNEEMKDSKLYHMPAEWENHEGTWLQWPNDRILRGYERDLERIWLMMVDVLHERENIHILVYDEQHKEHVASQLEYYRIGLKNIDISIIPTYEVWARDNGPIFVLDDQNNLVITDWTVNGWGGR